MKASDLLKKKGSSGKDKVASNKLIDWISKRRGTSKSKAEAGEKGEEK